tara:strand:- start:25764 stop:26351 length:588 start_codon:yes stop_codon:yes gene_type:complete
MIPMDVIQIIVQFSPLNLRYVWSLVCKKYKITENEWFMFGQQYNLTQPTKENIRGICQRYYGVQNNITKHTRHLWSEHLSEPLTVWSPWTPARYCSKNRMFFRKYCFVSFIRNLKTQFQLESHCLRVHKNEVGIIVNVRAKRIPMVYIDSLTKKRKRKIHISSAFKKMNSVRALIAFHVGADKLYLNVRGLEFLT